MSAQPTVEIGLHPVLPCSLCKGAGRLYASAVDDPFDYRDLAVKRRQEACLPYSETCPSCDGTRVEGAPATPRPGKRGRPRRRAAQEVA